MHDSLENTGIRPEALQRFIDEQIYTLAGTDRHAEVFTILLTGSRAVGIHTEESDIDIDVLCPESTFDSVHATPYPYLEKLMLLAAATPLGRQFCPFFQELTELIVASTQPAADVWGRLDTAFRRLCCSDLSEDAKLLQDACSAAMIAAGLDPNWVKADYNNIDELLQGRLGPFVV